MKTIVKKKAAMIFSEINRGDVFRKANGYDQTLFMKIHPIAGDGTSCSNAVSLFSATPNFIEPTTVVNVVEGAFVEGYNED